MRNEPNEMVWRTGFKVSGVLLVEQAEAEAAVEKAVTAERERVLEIVLEIVHNEVGWISAYKEIERRVKEGK